ncbi:hypothetical protein [Nocardia sp. NPDC059228]|uniref:hypothetical protein n=1 Tax=Nocardia sp. NPDC059228 TaxID=3346777 RepID=UPI0036B6C245
MSLFSRATAPREVSVYVSIHPDGHRSVSIHGGNVEEVASLMDAALAHPNVSAYPTAPMPPMMRAPWHVNGSVATEIG